MTGLGISTTGNLKKNPYAFAVANVAGASPSTSYSNNFIPLGFDGPIIARIVSGSATISNVSSSGFGASTLIFPKGTIYLKQTSSSSSNTSVFSTIALGTTTFSWKITTSAVTPGSQSYSSPGTYNFTVPAYNTLSVSLCGASGGGGGSYNDSCETDPNSYAPSGGNGGYSSFGSLVGQGGGGGQGGPGGNNGVNGSTGTNYGGSTSGGGGGTFSLPDLHGGNGGSGGNGQNNGATYSAGQLTVGGIITVVVGGAGNGGAGLPSCDPDDGNPDGGPGSSGQNGFVSVSWS